MARSLALRRTFALRRPAGRRTPGQVSVALRASGLRCDGVRLSLADGEAAGQEVFHVHLHVVPRYPGDGVVVTADWKKRPRELLDRDAALIRAALAVK
ncbi:HIT domain-containing protein [Nonomuraea maritima]|uniref:HIT domain-containing protein n=1 Tax=Nonomuraea maritima TaxID=683260 RepID=A0A1G9S255_9ACTN|nr:HIT family protein [Nonomuraea maritima]SDM29556.1 HIT domain-containing protein [Nonomuraea maritima]